MKKISFNGTDYVRASEVAKKFRYTQDYVGQLCRSKKVDARLVGRNWYVNLDSVVGYRKTKHKTQRTQAKIANKKVNKSHATPSHRRRAAKRVEPVLRTKTVRAAALRSDTSARSTPAVSYSQDEEVLIPLVTSDNTPHAKGHARTEFSRPRRHVQIETRSTVTVPVRSDKLTPTKFSSDKLPEISLSGKLSVTKAPSIPASKAKPSTLAVDELFEKNTGIPTQMDVDENADNDLDIRTAPDQVGRGAGAQVVESTFTPATVQAGTSGLQKSAFLTLLGLAVTSVFVGLLLFGAQDVVALEAQQRVTFSLDFERVLRVLDWR